MKTTVIYHSADFDGIFCREIAKKFLGQEDVEYIGWNFGDAAIPIPKDPGNLYVMDLPVDRVFGFDFSKIVLIDTPQDNKSMLGSKSIVWIDHHKTSIDTHPNMAGYRIDGVAACRLAWQWFYLHSQWDLRELHPPFALPAKEDFVDRKVLEPLAVRLAGEYDIWDKRDERADALQFGLRSKDLTGEDWRWLLTPIEDARGEYEHGMVNVTLAALLKDGRLLQRYQNSRDASTTNEAAFLIEWNGMKWLALNTTRCNSLTFAAKDIPETGHDALLAFGLVGPSKWKVSMYHAKDKTHWDLSVIAKANGGGGHRGACGFICATLPFEYSVFRK